MGYIAIGAEEREREEQEAAAPGVILAFQLETCISAIVINTNTHVSRRKSWFLMILLTARILTV